METGTVKWYNDAKEYGFILADNDNASILARKSEIQADPRTLFEFQRVEFERISTNTGLCASHINIVMTRDFSLYNHDFTSLKGQRLNLSTFIGQVVLVVNTASACGLTDHYAGLEELYTKYKDKGFVVLAFPANQFADQEPGTNEEIAQFCETTYGITFPIMEKSEVVGANRNSFYADLEKQTGEVPAWNFHKYLISKNGSIVKSFGHLTKPDELIPAIEEMLNDRA